MTVKTFDAYEAVSYWLGLEGFAKSDAAVVESTTAHLVELLIKAKYIKRIPTGDPKRPYRYVYHRDEQKRWRHAAWDTVVTALKADQEEHGKSLFDRDGSRLVHFGENVMKLPPQVLKLAMEHVKATHGKKAQAMLQSLIDHHEGSWHPDSKEAKLEQQAAAAKESAPKDPAAEAKAAVEAVKTENADHATKLRALKAGDAVSVNGAKYTLSRDPRALPQYGKTEMHVQGARGGEALIHIPDNPAHMASLTRLGGLRGGSSQSIRVTEVQPGHGAAKAIADAKREAAAPSAASDLHEAVKKWKPQWSPNGKSMETPLGTAEVVKVGDKHVVHIAGKRIDLGAKATYPDAEKAIVEAVHGENIRQIKEKIANLPSESDRAASAETQERASGPFTVKGGDHTKSAAGAARAEKLAGTLNWMFHEKRTAMPDRLMDHFHRDVRSTFEAAHDDIKAGRQDDAIGTYQAMEAVRKKASDHAKDPSVDARERESAASIAGNIGARMQDLRAAGERAEASAKKEAAKPAEKPADKAAEADHLRSLPKGSHVRVGGRTWEVTSSSGGDRLFGDRPDGRKHVGATMHELSEVGTGRRARIHVPSTHNGDSHIGFAVGAKTGFSDDGATTVLPSHVERISKEQAIADNKSQLSAAAEKPSGKTVHDMHGNAWNPGDTLKINGRNYTVARTQGGEHTATKGGAVLAVKDQRGGVHLVQQFQSGAWRIAPAHAGGASQERSAVVEKTGAPKPETTKTPQKIVEPADAEKHRNDDAPVRVQGGPGGNDFGTSRGSKVTAPKDEPEAPKEGRERVMHDAEHAPWKLDPSQYKSAKGVHTPHIAEISLMQYANLSGAQKARYDAERAKAWQASGDAHKEWAGKVAGAHAAGKITKDTPGLSREARSIVMGREVDQAHTRLDHEHEAARKANRVTYDDAKKGDVVHVPRYGAVAITGKSGGRITATQSGQTGEARKVSFAPSEASKIPEHAYVGRGTIGSFNSVPERQVKTSANLAEWHRQKAELHGAHAERASAAPKSQAETTAAVEKHVDGLKGKESWHRRVHAKHLGAQLGVSTIAARKGLDEMVKRGKARFLGADNGYMVND